MAIRIQQVSDYGTSNPIAARLSIQTKDLLRFYNLSDVQRDKLFGIFFSNLQPKLMACFRIKEKLTEEVRAHQKSIDEGSIPVQAQGRAYTLPSILDLEHHAETFLYNAKSVLRDLTEVFAVLFDKDFKKKAQYDRVLKWARSKFGEDDAFVEMLKDDEDGWIKRIIKMRNAVEHPGGHSGVLHVENFTSIERGNTILVVEPVWYLNDEEKIPIVQEMEVMVSDLLTFCEETLVLCLEHFKEGFPIFVVEISENERDEACPVRVKNLAASCEASGPPN